MTMPRHIPMMAACAASALLVGAAAGELRIAWNSIDCGALTLSAGTGDAQLTLTGTIGQPDAGPMAGGDIQLTGGVWPATTLGEAVPPSPDINGDEIVDGADLGLLLSSWGTNDRAADLNADGWVDGADLGILLSAWGE